MSFYRKCIWIQQKGKSTDRVRLQAFVRHQIVDKIFSLQQLVGKTTWRQQHLAIMAYFCRVHLVDTTSRQNVHLADRIITRNGYLAKEN